MRAATAIVTIAILILTVVVVKSTTITHSDVTKSPSQGAMSIYGLHVGHPDMKGLPVQEAPMP